MKSRLTLEIECDLESGSEQPDSAWVLERVSIAVQMAIPTCLLIGHEEEEQRLIFINSTQEITHTMEESV